MFSVLSFSQSACSPGGWFPWNLSDGIPLTCSNLLFNWGPLYPMDRSGIPTYWQAGGWPLTELPSCYSCCCWLVEPAHSCWGWFYIIQCKFSSFKTQAYKCCLEIIGNCTTKGLILKAVVDLGGTPKAQNFLNFMQFFGKFWQNCMLAPRRVGAPPTEILGSAPGKNKSLSYVLQYHLFSQKKMGEWSAFSVRSWCTQVRHQCVIFSWK